MRCRTVLTRIDAFRTAELPAVESGDLREHLEACPSCGESAGDIEHLSNALRSLAAATEIPPDRFERFDDHGESVWAACSTRGLTMIYRGGSLEEFRQRYASRFGRELRQAALPDALRRQVANALDGAKIDAPLVDLGDRTSFERRVLEILSEIPRGEVRTYSWVAERAGHPRATRAVGTVCARNVVPFVVPCHRVVPASGGVGDYAFGAPAKREMLRREGVPVDELDRLAREGIRFIGSKTTHIFCFPTCRHARQIRDANRVAFHTAAEAAEEGFRPCKRCKPVIAA